MEKDELRWNRRRFEAGIRRLNEISDVEAGLDLAYGLMLFAQDGGCGYFASSEIESRLREFSKELSPPKVVEARPNTVLMVMTTAYLVGGHTRVVERWIEQDPSRRYSLVLTNQVNEDWIPERLRSAVECSGGECLVLDVRESRMGRAQKLRDFAATFEKVVLHVHMYDVIPLVAFGSETFTRPVGFYNHADHVPWLGVSIADCVAELREWGATLSRECRGVRESVTIGIPSEEKMDADRKVHEAGVAFDVRTRYGIPSAAPLVLTCGRASKYQPVAGLDFLDVIRGILSADKDVVVLAVGLVLENVPGWTEASRAFGRRLKAIAPVPFEQLTAFCRAADLVIDSYPMCGCTALADALMAGCPVLIAPGLFGQDDWVFKIDGYCASVQNLVERSIVLLKNKPLAQKQARHDLDVYRAMRSPQQFKERIEVFFGALRNPHRIHPFEDSVGLRPEIDQALWEESQRVRELFREIPGVISYRRYYTPVSQTRVLTLLGKDFVLRRRLTPVGKMLNELEASCGETSKGGQLT